MPGSLLALLIGAMTFLGAAASLFLKQASGAAGGVLRSWRFWAGGALYGVCALLNIVVLRYLEYSLVLPLTALTYVWSLLLARAVLRERLTALKVVAVGLIVLGAALVAG